MDSEDRLRRIESVTDAALAHLDVDDLLAALLDRVREILEVDTAAVMLVDMPSRTLYATAAIGLEEEVRQGFRVPIGRGFAGRVAAEKRPVILDQITAANAVNPILIQKGIRAVLGVPMLAGGELVGVLHVGSLSDRRFTDDDVMLLQLVADRAALATEARLTRVDRWAAAALQRSLLPPTLPELPGLQLAARYIPDSRSGVGGDWYDVFTLPSGWLGIVMGDVVGHGLRSAVVMGRLRSALRAYALDYSDPAEVLTKLDRKAQHFEAGMFATVVYAMIEPSLERIHVSLAGHPAPVFATTGSPAEVLRLESDLPIGVELGHPRTTTTVDLPPGSLVCFYTDGLIERRGQEFDEGLKRLCTLVEKGTADEVCARIVAQLIDVDITADDAALLVAGRPEEG
ncbi:PP2C family protein-serine/threonine phosphatase [Flindersiella endophytica]